MDKHYLYPGAVFVSKQPHIVDTILGSCISVCLWDPILKFGSINHYMLPVWNGEGNPTFRYGDIAIAEVIKRMVNLGSTKKNLKAKVFGGSDLGNYSNGVFNIGQRNALFARDRLKEERIPIESFSVGGNLARKLIFYSGTGKVLLMYIRQGIKATDQNN